MLCPLCHGMTAVSSKGRPWRKVPSYLCTVDAHRLTSVNILNLRNIAETAVQLGPGFNCFTGPNGSGKTTMLDAVHYLCVCKGFVNAIDAQNIRTGQQLMSIWGDFARPDGTTEHIQCAIRDGKKILRHDKKEYQRLTDHIGRYSCVVIAPTDAELITGGSEERRRFMDSLLSQTDRQYLDHLVQYGRALQHRNTLLRHFADTRTFSAENLEVWDLQMVRHATYLHRARQLLFDRLPDLFRKYYSQLCGGAELVSIVYESSLTGVDFHALLSDARDRDRAANTTTMGPHKDDAVITIHDGQPLRRIGSQGQQKTALVALRLAQCELMSERMGASPILLLDDVLDKLDPMRVGKLVHTVSQEPFGQVFISHTDRSAMHRLLAEWPDTVYFEVESGELVPTLAPKIPLPT